MSVSRRVRDPFYDLARIQHLVVHGPRFDLAIEKGLRAIVAQRRCGAGEAKEFAKEAVLGLTKLNYSETLEYADGTKADVYGKVLEEQGWYIKVAIAQNPERADVMSCHLAMHPIHTQGGTIPRAHRW